MKAVYRLIFIVLLLAPIFNSVADQKKSAEIRSYLPDGTEIRIRNDKAYYYCKGKFMLLPDEAYMLADGSLFTVSKGKITELVLMAPNS
jgi:hypothetical protein